MTFLFVNIGNRTAMHFNYFWGMNSKRVHSSVNRALPAFTKLNRHYYTMTSSCDSSHFNIGSSSAILDTIMSDDDHDKEIRSEKAPDLPSKNEIVKLCRKNCPKI